MAVQHRRTHEERTCPPRHGVRRCHGRLYARVTQPCLETFYLTDRSCSDLFRRWGAWGCERSIWTHSKGQKKTRKGERKDVLPALTTNICNGNLYRGGAGIWWTSSRFESLSARCMHVTPVESGYQAWSSRAYSGLFVEQGINRWRGVSDYVVMRNFWKVRQPFPSEEFCDPWQCEITSNDTIFPVRKLPHLLQENAALGPCGARRMTRRWLSCCWAEKLGNIGRP